MYWFDWFLVDSHRLYDALIFWNDWISHQTSFQNNDNDSRGGRGGGSGDDKGNINDNDSSDNGDSIGNSNERSISGSYDDGNSDNG